MDSVNPREDCIPANMRRHTQHGDQTSRLIRGFVPRRDPHPQPCGYRR